MSKGRRAFGPEKGKVYENHGGGTFICTSTPWRHMATGVCAWMCNVKSGWTFCAKGIGIYPDGTIDWDYSIGGHFDGRKEQRYEEV